MASKKYYGYVDNKGIWRVQAPQGYEVKATNFCAEVTQYIIDCNGWTNSTPIDDARGIDAYTSDGKKVQLKVFFDNSPTITFDFDFNKAENIHKNAHYIFKKALKKYCNQFDLFVIYLGKYRGEPVTMNNLLILDNKTAFEWITEHGHRAYMKYKGGERGYAQIHLRKTACGDIEKIEIK